MKSGNLNFLEPYGPPQACNGTALPFSDSIVGTYKEASQEALMYIHVDLSQEGLLSAHIVVPQVVALYLQIGVPHNSIIGTQKAALEEGFLKV